MSTDSFNRVTDERRKELRQLVNRSLFSICVALYESKLVKRVRVGDVLALFGFSDPEVEDQYVEFDSPKFMEDYRAYKEAEGKEAKAKNSPTTFDPKESDDPLDDMLDQLTSEDRVLH